MSAFKEVQNSDEIQSISEKSLDMNSLALQFFCLGAGTGTTFTSLTLAIGFFQQILGSNVLSDMGICQFGANFLVMSIILLVPFKVSQITVFRILTCAYGYLLLLNLHIVGNMLTDTIPTAVEFLFFVTINGVCTGATASFVASLAATANEYNGSPLLCPFPPPAGVAHVQAQISGAAFGLLVPTLIQTVHVFVASYGDRISLGGNTRTQQKVSLVAVFTGNLLTESI